MKKGMIKGIKIIDNNHEIETEKWVWGKIIFLKNAWVCHISSKTTSILILKWKCPVLPLNRELYQIT